MLPVYQIKCISQPCPTIFRICQLNMGPLLQHSHLTIEKVQRRAIRWTLNNYNYYSSVTTMLQNLNWPTLQYRRQRARLSLFYKSLNNLTALEIPPYYTPNNHSSRLHHQLSYIHPYARTNTYMYSFFLRTIKEWNSLPTRVVTSTTLPAFQAQLDSYTFANMLNFCNC